MVPFNQPISVPKSLDRLIQQRHGIDSTKPDLKSIPDEPPDSISFCEDVDSSDYSDHVTYHNIFTKIVATSDILSADLSGQMPMQSVHEYQNILFFIWNNYIQYEPMVTRSAKSHFKAYQPATDFSALSIVFSTFFV